MQKTCNAKNLQCKKPAMQKTCNAKNLQRGTRGTKGEQLNY
jgi:hypothetical protein